MSYLATITMLDSENKNPNHREHIYQFSNLCREMIEQLTPQIVKQVLLDTYMELYVRIQMMLDGKEVSFNDINNYIMNMIRDNLIQSLNKL